MTNLVAGVLKANDLRKVHVYAEGGAGWLCSFLTICWALNGALGGVRGRRGHRSAEDKKHCKGSSRRDPLLRGLVPLEPQDTGMESVRIA